MSTRIKFRRDTAAFWSSHNPILQLAEPGYETDTGKIKIGDGATEWNSLAYAKFGITIWDKFTTTIGVSTYNRSIPAGATIQLFKYGSTFVEDTEFTLAAPNITFTGFDVVDAPRVSTATAVSA